MYFSTLHPWRLLALFCLSILVQTAWAENENSGPRTELQASLQAVKDATVHGPSEIELADQAILSLPAGYAFVPTSQARRLMEAMGNPGGDSFLGLILPDGEQKGWMVAASFEKSGYIKDDDAKAWDLDELLDTLKRSADEINQVRAERGLGQLEVVGWVQAPAYDPDEHRLVWSLAVRGKNAGEGELQSVNYNTYALGREGYISLNLVTGLDELESRKPVAQTLLASLDYHDGKRYQDFDAGSDHVAEYGLAALVGGIAAKKLGLFALAAIYLAKFGKIAAVSVIALLGLFGKRFGRRKGTDTLEA